MARHGRSTNGARRTQLAFMKREASLPRKPKVAICCTSTSMGPLQTMSLSVSLIVRETSVSDRGEEGSESNGNSRKCAGGGVLLEGLQRCFHLSIFHKHHLLNVTSYSLAFRKLQCRNLLSEVDDCRECRNRPNQTRAMTSAIAITLALRSSSCQEWNSPSNDFASWCLK